MEALRASYGDSSSDSDTDDLSPAGSVALNSGEKSTGGKQERESISLPPPPLELLDSIGSTGEIVNLIVLRIRFITDCSHDAFFSNFL